MISNTNPHFDYKCTFIEWVEIRQEFRGNSLFSKVVEKLFDLYNTDEIHFESSKETLPMYCHMNAINKGTSQLTENAMMILNAADFNSRVNK